MRKPFLAIDFDGVIAETLSRKSAWIAHNLGMDIAPGDCSKSRCEPQIGVENYRRMSRELGYADTLDCPPIEGAVEGIRRLSKYFSIRVYTARPEEKTHWAREWLKHNGLADFIDEVISTYGRSKATMAVASASHALVDNDIRHLLEGTPESTQRIFFSPAGGTHDKVDGITPVGGWFELVERLILRRVAAA